ncbi:SseB family protein [Streptomyces sp. NPDC002994]|uniref:SseB family protein n=1 Tax=Streptomyces sp. NPDC002994 TaxID=3154441 RepID=UPI0033B25647
MAIVLLEDVGGPNLALPQVQSVLGEFRRSLVLVPIRDGGILTGDQAGLRWVFAFTDTDTLTAFAQARGEGGRWEFRRVYGARLLDETLAEIGVPCGVAVDVGSEGAFLLPPAQGIVPDHVAVAEGSDQEAPS